jgi:hypothetical protein
MYKLIFVPCVIALILMLPATAQQTAKTHRNKYTPSHSYVPDAATAVKIAEAVLVPVYGEQKIVSERPFTAILEGSVWTVEGTLYCGDGKPGSCLGGTATVKLSKDDARILFMMHYK